MTVVERYHNEDNFLTLFNPSKQVAYTRDLYRTFRGNAPSLGLVAKSFGPGARDNWIDIQLTELAVFSGCKDKFNSHQIDTLIGIIAEEYGYLKVTELMYFFRKFKAGEYGKFYGAVDPLTITCALKEFCDDRRAILHRLDQTDKERQKRDDHQHHTYLLRYREHTRKCFFYSCNFRSNDFTFEEFEEIWWLFNLGYERGNHGYIES